MPSETTAQGNYVLALCSRAVSVAALNRSTNFLTCLPSRDGDLGPHSLNLLEFWPIECGTSNAMWLLKLGNKQPCNVSLVHWNTDCWSSEQPCKCSFLGAAPMGMPHWEVTWTFPMLFLCVVRRPMSHSSWWYSNLTIRHTSEEASRWLQDPLFESPSAFPVFSAEFPGITKPRWASPCHAWIATPQNSWMY